MDRGSQRDPRGGLTKSATVADLPIPGMSAPRWEPGRLCGCGSNPRRQPMSAHQGPVNARNSGYSIRRKATNRGALRQIGHGGRFGIRAGPGSIFPEGRISGDDSGARNFPDRRCATLDHAMGIEPARNHSCGASRACRAASHAGDESGYCFPSLARISVCTGGMLRGSIVRCLESLEAKGLIDRWPKIPEGETRRRGGRGTNTEYLLGGRKF